MFATMVIAIVNKHTGSVRYLNAGHDPILFGGQGVAYRSLPPPDGILIGMDEGATYEVATLTLAKDDALVLYTDGITEAMSREGRFFTLDRLMACLDETPGESAQGLADRIAGAVEAFVDGAPQSDDLTLLILKYRGT
jgi:phosphoserine phosphatase RsbU/P